MKTTKKIISFLILGLLVIGLLPFTPSGVTAKAENNSNPIIISPTHLELVGSTLYVYDEYQSTLFAYNTTTSSTTEVKKLPEGSTLHKLVSNGTELFALIKSESDASLNLVSGNELNPLSFEKDYSLSQISDFTLIGSTIYTLKDGNIDYATLTGNTISPFVTIEKSNLFSGNNVVTLTHLTTYQNELIGATSTEGYLIHPSSQNLEKKITLTDNNTIKFLNSNFVVTSNGELINVITGDTSTPFNNINVSGFSSLNNTHYVSTKTTHQVHSVLADNSLSDLEINPNITPNYYTANNFIHVKSTAEIDLYYKPYSVEPTLNLPTGTYMNIIGEHGNHYYTLIIENETNRFLYIPKSSALEVIKPNISPVTYTATRNLKIFALPSTNMSGNSVIGNVNTHEQIEVQTSSTISNTHGELFFLVNVNNTYGFIRSNFLQSTKGAVELTTPCNAKTKRTTTLFKNIDGTGEIISLEKSTRIALLEELSPNKDYIKAEYQDPSGKIYTGYINAEDISPDGLSTLQVLGLVLVVTNLGLLVTIMLIKRRSKKWKTNA